MSPSISSHSDMETGVMWSDGPRKNRKRTYGALGNSPLGLSTLFFSAPRRSDPPRVILVVTIEFGFFNFRFPDIQFWGISVFLTVPIEFDSSKLVGKLRS